MNKQFRRKVSFTNEEIQTLQKLKETFVNLLYEYDLYTATKIVETLKNDHRFTMKNLLDEYNDFVEINKHSCAGLTMKDFVKKFYIIKAFHRIRQNLVNSLGFNASEYQVCE